MALTYPHNYNSPLNKAVIRVDDNWYDCTAWRNSHPGGAQIIDQFHNSDATDAFYSLHSEEAIQKLHKMKGKPVEGPTARNKISEDFQKWRVELEKDGWFDRIWIVDFGRNILPMIALYVIGTMISGTYPVLATLLIGFAMQQFGWIGHDMAHARGALGMGLGKTVGPLFNGFSSQWWSQKHNTHHTFPNRREFDSDIHNEPIVHLWFPDAKSDVWYRKYQHHYYMFAYAMLYVSWRFQSIVFVVGSKHWGERAMLALNYMWLAYLPWKVAIGSIILGGWFVALVVTANHQTEPLIDAQAPYNFITDQFDSTRDVLTTWTTEYFFGGMQYQLEHHLFPIMPRYYYPSFRPIAKKFAQDHDLKFHVTPVKEIFVMNYDVIKKFAQEAPKKKE